MMRWISRCILSLLGWTILGAEPLLQIPKFVVAIGPHTSNWDFPLGLMVRWATGLEKIRFIGKESLFRPPFGWIFKALGGYPVIRSESKNQVDRYIELLHSKAEFAIVLSPEGTRKKVQSLKSGYYYIAKGAGVPIVPASIDFPSKTLRFYEPFMAGDDEFADRLRVEQCISSATGKHPELGFRIQA